MTQQLLTYTVQQLNDSKNSSTVIVNNVQKFVQINKLLIGQYTLALT